MSKFVFKKVVLVFKNFIAINNSMLPLNLIYVFLGIINIFINNFIWWIIFIIQSLYFLWWIWKNIYYQWNCFKFIDYIWDSPLSLIIGKLGTGKTLLLTYLNQYIEYKADHIFSNYPIDDEMRTKLITFKNLDFRDKKKMIPLDNSFIGFDESFLYIDGTNPKETKIQHEGKIPWVLLARHFRNRAVFTAQRSGMVWNNIRQLASSVIIPLSLRKPKQKKSFIPKFFILKLAIFGDIETFDIWRVEAIKRVTNGKGLKNKTSVALGIRFFKILIPIEVARSYDSFWLEFVRDMKNSKVKENYFTYWNDIKDLSNDEKLELFDIDILKRNVGVKN